MKFLRGQKPYQAINATPAQPEGVSLDRWHEFTSLYIILNVSDCGSYGDARSAIKYQDEIFKNTQNLLRAHDHTEKYILPPELRRADDAYQFVYAHYLKKRLGQIISAVANTDFPTNIMVDKINETPRQNEYSELAAWLDRNAPLPMLGVSFKSQSGTSSAENAVEGLKEKCHMHIHNLDGYIARLVKKYGAEAFARENLVVRLSPTLLSYVFDNDSQAPAPLPPSGMK